MVGKLQLEGIGMTSRRTRDRLVNRLVEQGIADVRVLETISNTPRHLFVDEALSHRAYEDTALPIGFKQTISQPYIVARMTEIVLGKEGGLEKVLEIGTGSGYQTAVLAQLIPHVFSVERISALQNKSRKLLRQLNLRNVQLKHSDGSWGWPESGPYDAIIATAAPEKIPESLLEQLAPDGILVLPVGGAAQKLQVVIRREDSETFERKTLESVCFVPLVPGVLS